MRYSGLSLAGPPGERGNGSVRSSRVYSLHPLPPQRTIFCRAKAKASEAPGTNRGLSFMATPLRRRARSDRLASPSPSPSSPRRQALPLCRARSAPPWPACPRPRLPPDARPSARLLVTDRKPLLPLHRSVAPDHRCFRWRSQLAQLEQAELSIGSCQPHRSSSRDAVPATSPCARAASVRYSGMTLTRQRPPASPLSGLPTRSETADGRNSFVQVASLAT